MDADGWPFTRDRLEKPWNDEACLFDLRWYADRERMTDKRRPGAPTLARMWGVTHWHARQLIKGGRWVDPAIDSASPPQARRKPPASGATVEPTIPEESRKVPASPPQAIRPTRGTKHRTQNTATDQTVSVNGSMPEWAKGRRAPNGIQTRDVVAAVMECLTAVKQKTLNPSRQGTDAKQVIALWKAQGWPPPDEFTAEFALVATAARECPHKLFARDMRAEGWADGTDRSRHVRTLCVQASWTDRLEAAQEWDAAGRPTTATAAPAAHGGEGSHHHGQQEVRAEDYDLPIEALEAMGLRVIVGGVE